MIIRNNIIDSLKGFAILLMVFGHLIQFTSIDNSYLSNPIYIFIYSFHMPLFMMISGFFFSKSLNQRSLNNVLNNRVVTVLLPYFSWTTIFIIIWFVLKGNNLSFLELLLKYFETFLFVSKLWFLWVLFICILLTSLNIYIQRYIGKISIFFLLLFIYLLPETEMLGLINIKYMFPFFILGYCNNKYYNKLNKWIPYISGISLLLYPIMLFFWEKENFSFVIDFKNIEPIIYKYITAFSGILMIIFVFKKIYTKFQFNYLERIGKNSIAIYIISDYFIELMSYLKFLIPNNYFYNSLIFLILTLLIAEICLIIEKLLNKNKIIAFTLFGKRSKKLSL
nr:acyltransferase family protein [uncultured Flavobacterium sp.]